MAHLGEQRRPHHAHPGQRAPDRPRRGDESPHGSRSGDPSQQSTQCRDRADALARSQPLRAKTTERRTTRRSLHVPTPKSTPPPTATTTRPAATTTTAVTSPAIATPTA